LSKISLPVKRFKKNQNQKYNKNPFKNKETLTLQEKMDLLNPLLITLLPTGLVFVFAGWVLLKNPPKGINSIYGYRTSKSMKSKKNWDLAQTYSAREMMRIGWTLSIVGLLGGWMQVSDTAGITVSLVLIISSVIWLIYKTEKELKKKDQIN